jgi:hypothetical protein
MTFSQVKLTDNSIVTSFPPFLFVCSVLYQQRSVQRSQNWTLVFSILVPFVFGCLFVCGALFCFVFETGSLYIAQAGLELTL